MIGEYGERAALALGLVGAIVLGSICLTRAGSPAWGRGAPTETPDDTLRRPFTSGAITREKDDRMRRTLEE